MLLRCTLVLCGLGLVLAAATSAEAVNYAFFDLGLASDGTAYDTGSPAYSINSNNVVSGRLQTGGPSNAYLWSPTTGRTILPDMTGTTAGIGYSINNSGVVVGSAGNSGGGNYSWYYTTNNTITNLTDDTATDVRTKFPGTMDTTKPNSVLSVNSSGAVLGRGSLTTAKGTYYYWDGVSANVQVIAAPTGYTIGSGTDGKISDTGWVAGDGFNSWGGAEAIVWHVGDPTATSINPLIKSTLSTPGDSCASNANAVNNAGQAAGYYYGDNLSFHAFLYNNSSTVVNLGSLIPNGDTYPNAISNSGVVVGSSAFGTNPNFISPINHAFIWTPTTPNGTTGSMVDLTSLVLNQAAIQSNQCLYAATGINGSGSISGYMLQCNGVGNAQTYRGFALIPTIAADANLDGTVNIGDLSKVLTNYDKNGVGWADGDFDGSGAVDVTDLSKVLTNYNTTSGAAAAVKPVPEPGTLILLATILGGLTCHCRKRKMG